MTPGQQAPAYADPLRSDDEPTLEEDVNLPTFVVLARLAGAGESAEQAEASVRSRLTAARGLFDDVAVERREDDGTWLFEVRFVVVSIDAHTAVTGVSETLVAAGLSPDEVWVAPEPEPVEVD